MRISVTAATGQLGRQAVLALLDLGVPAEDLVAVARTPTKANDLAERGVTVRAGDYDRPDQLKAALQGVDVVLLVSGMAPPDARVKQHRNVISAAQAAGARKMVYTSVQGPEEGTAFSPIVQSNRQTEADVRASGLAWSIGRNGIYIEPDVEYIETYRALGEIANCAGEGKCGYTTRAELAIAYAHMLTANKHNGQTHNLHGEPITQATLARHLSEAFDASLSHRTVTVADYRQERIAELGEFIGSVIAGIYHGIAIGAYQNPSHFEAVTGRPHQSWPHYFAQLKTA